MSGSVRAAVTMSPGQTVVAEFPVPAVGPSTGLLMVEASGVCGADKFYSSSTTSPRILGHEVVGRIAGLGDEAAERWGFAPGDRVVLEEYLPCGHCRFCMTSEFRLCLESDPFASERPLRYGFTGTDVAPSLWGGYAEMMYLNPRSVLHRAPEGVPATILAMALPFANGHEWTVRAGKAGPGSSLLIIGPGQQGLGCVVAGVSAGAETIIVAGLEADEHRLSAARRLGATHTLSLSGGDLAAAVLEITGGRGVDLVVDAAAGNASTVPAAIEAVAKAGRIVLAIGSATPVPLPLDRVQAKNLTLHGARGHSWESVEWAIATLSRDHHRFGELTTHRFGLDQVDDAIRLLGSTTDSTSIHISVVPEAG